MSPRNPADTTVPELIDEFRQLADLLGNPFQFDVRPERYRRTPERASLVARMNALTPEMRLRASADALRALMEDSDNDIRAWAAMRFGAIDPDLSDAATAGICERMSTRQAQRLTEYARTPPPARPTLTEMSLAELVTRFSDACLREYWTRYCGEDTQPLDVELRNKIVGEVRQIVAELRRRGACDRLLPLLESPNITERAESARATFEVAPERAFKTLEEVAASKDSCEFGRADQSLQYFRERASRKPQKNAL
jgi:HEAT repeat protein